MKVNAFKHLQTKTAIVNKMENLTKNSGETRIVIVDKLNRKWDIGSFESLRERCKSKKETAKNIQLVATLVRLGSILPETLPGAKCISK